MVTYKPSVSPTGIEKMGVDRCLCRHIENNVIFRRKQLNRSVIKVKLSENYANLQRSN